MTQQRMTKQKKMVLDIAKKHCDHPTADEIYLEVREIDNKVSRGTVFRNLGQLSESGMLTHVKLPGANRYDGRLDLHCHMVCTECGMVCDAPLAYQDSFDQQMEDQTGFKISRHRTIFEGLCPACQKKQRAHAGAK